MSMTEQKKSYRVALMNQTHEEFEKAYWDGGGARCMRAVVNVWADNPEEAERLVRSHVNTTPPLQAYPIREVEVRECDHLEGREHIN